jgi:hypothetical protein
VPELPPWIGDSPADEWTIVGSGGNAPPFASDWAGGAAPNQLRFRKEGGLVRIAGQAAKATLGATTELIFTLPADFRSPRLIRAPIVRAGSTQQYVDIETDGSVRVRLAPAAAEVQHVNVAFPIS